jgi:hypothetical protein
VIHVKIEHLKVAISEDLSCRWVGIYAERNTVRPALHTHR